MRSDRQTVVFLKDITLPRFTMRKGEEWEARRKKFIKDGLEIGGGFVTSDYYRMERACANYHLEAK